MSNLPDRDEMMRQLTISIVQAQLVDYPSSLVKVAFDVIAQDGRKVDNAVRMYEIDDPRLNGHLPSKVLVSHGLVTLIFYVSSSLPSQVRPFEGAPVYVLLLDPPAGGSIEYDGRLPVYIDQVVDAQSIKYVVMFGQASYDQIVIKEQ